MCDSKIIIDEKVFEFKLDILNSSTVPIGSEFHREVLVKITASPGLRVKKDIFNIQKISPLASRTLTVKLQPLPGQVAIGDKPFVQVHLFVRGTHAECTPPRP